MSGQVEQDGSIRIKMAGPLLVTLMVIAASIIASWAVAMYRIGDLDKRVTELTAEVRRGIDDRYRREDAERDFRVRDDAIQAIIRRLEAIDRRP